MQHVDFSYNFAFSICCWNNIVNYRPFVTPSNLYWLSFVPGLSRLQPRCQSRRNTATVNRSVPLQTKKVTRPTSFTKEHEFFLMWFPHKKKPDFQGQCKFNCNEEDYARIFAIFCLMFPLAAMCNQKLELLSLHFQRTIMLHSIRCHKHSFNTQL